MATYAVGDIQGCYDELRRLLDHINFDATLDHLWLAGDLVNRGPHSLAVLEFVKSLESAATVVLGNHDLHLLACACVERFKPGKKDTFSDVIESPRCDELMDWLRTCPLFHHDPKLDFAMVHAGLPAQWSLGDAAEYAREVESVLRGEQFLEFLSHIYGNSPDRWEPSLQAWERLRLITNYFTRLRFTAADGHIDFRFKGQLGSQPKELQPWYDFFELPASTSLVFGHWSALHLSAKEMHTKRIYALDTGAVWGGTLTALRLEDREFFSVPSSIALPIAD